MEYRIREPERPNRGNRRRNRYYGKVILLCMMIGFCVIALIEIIYGQEKLKLERERIALEERNAQTLEALETQQEGTYSSSAEHTSGQENADIQTEFTNLTSVTEDNTGGTPAPETADGTVQPDADSAGGNEEAQEEESEYDMQIVFLGDSILDNEREHNGVASLISEHCNADVYNMSMGGTTAALSEGDSPFYDQWDSRCLLGVVNAITGRIDTELFDDYKAGTILDECDFSKTDYFVIEYGINDFLAQIPTSKYMANGEIRDMDEAYTYGGALDEAVVKLHDEFPEAKILLVAPHYCLFFNGETFIGDAYTLNYGYGTLVDYMRSCGYVYEQHKDENVIFYNTMELSGIDAYTADDDLEDGIHLTSQGRKKYAQVLSEKILEDFYPKE